MENQSGGCICLLASVPMACGKPYQFKMRDGKLAPSAEWLSAALREYRASTR